MKTKLANSYVNWLIKESGPVTADELRYALKKHEDRETPAQEAEESEKEQDIERRAGIHEKTAAWNGLSKLAKKKTTVLKKGQPAQRGSIGAQLEGLGLKGTPTPPPSAPAAAAATAGKWSTGKKVLVGAGAVGLAAGGAYLYKKHKDKKMAEPGQTKAAFWRGFEKKAGLWDGRISATIDVNPDTVRKLQEGPGKALEEFLSTLKKPSTAVKALAAAALLSGTAGFGYHAGKNTADGMAKKIGDLVKGEKKKK